MSVPPGNKRPFKQINGERIGQMFGGPGAGILTSNAQRVAQARKNYAGRGGRRAALLSESNKSAEANKEKLGKALLSTRQWRLVNRPEHVRRSQLESKRRKEATKLETHALGYTPADPTFKSVANAARSTLRARRVVNNKNKEEREQAAKKVTAGAIAAVLEMNKKTENRRARERADFKQRRIESNKKKYNELIKSGETISNADRTRIALLYNNLANKLANRNAAEKKAAKRKANAIKLDNRRRAVELASEQEKSANRASREERNKAVKNAKAAEMAKEFQKNPKATANAKNLQAIVKQQNAIPMYNEAAARKALSNYLATAVKPRYNKALVNAMLRLPELKLNEATKQNLIRSQQSRGRRFAGNLGRGAIVAGGALRRGIGSLGAALGRLRGAPSFIAGANGSRIPVGYVFKTGPKGLGYYRNNKALQSQIETLSYGPAFGGAPSFIAGANGSRIPVGYVFKTGPKGLGYYRNNKALQSQIETLSYGHLPRNRGTGTGPNRGTGTGGGGIIFKPTITVGAARIGAQTFGGTRVGGQQMGSQRTSTGNVAGARTGGIEVGGPRAATGNVGGARTNGNIGGARPNGNVGVTSEQLIRAGGGSEAIEKGINALRQTGGNAAKASAISRLPMNTFTNIYAMGGPVAAKKAVESRRRRRRVTKKKPVKSKPRKQYIKLTPYQFKRLTDHIKKNNLRKVLIKEITH